MDRLLSPAAVAKIIGCTPETARAKMGTMPGVVNIGTPTRQIMRVPESSLRAWLANRTFVRTGVKRIERRERG